VQLGVSGSITPNASGNLYLFFNDDLYADNKYGFWITFSWTDPPLLPPVTQTFFVDPANSELTLAPFLAVTAGKTYSYSTVGYVDYFYPNACLVNADGTIVSDGDPAICDPALSITPTTCPTLKPKSLVGKMVCPTSFDCEDADDDCSGFDGCPASVVLTMAVPGLATQTDTFTETDSGYLSSRTGEVLGCAQGTTGSPPQIFRCWSIPFQDYWGFPTLCAVTGAPVGINQCPIGSGTFTFTATDGGDACDEDDPEMQVGTWSLVAA
jgi:hypothetical protein